MQSYYIRIEDMPSLVSHQLSIIKYVVLKKIFFFLCFDRLIWTWTWTRTSLDSDLTRTRTSLDLDLTRTRTSLDLDLSWTRQRWTWLQPYLKMNIHKLQKRFKNSLISLYCLWEWKPKIRVIFEKCHAQNCWVKRFSCKCLRPILFPWLLVALACAIAASLYC